jgi:FtsP/CotA-like multicopper oxidase with cupredoxin domain
VTQLPINFPPLVDYRRSNISAQRTFYFSQNNDEDTFAINNKVYQDGQVDIRIYLGAIERWTVINVAQEAHFFHIHQGSFQVESVNGVMQPFYGYSDSVLLPSAPENGSSTVVVIIPFTDPLQIGKYPFRKFCLEYFCF